MNRLIATIATFVLTLATAHAATGAARAKLDAFSTGLHSLTGNFTQTLTDANGQPGKSSSGKIGRAHV